MKFSFKDFFTKCDQIRRKRDLVTFNEEILNEKLRFLSSGSKGKVSTLIKNNITDPLY